MGVPRLHCVVAHPDDETFGCGSILLHAVARTAVCCATRGEQGASTDPDLDPDHLGVVREAELRAAAEVLGVSEVSLLGSRDSGMDGPADEGTLVATPVARPTCTSTRCRARCSAASPRPRLARSPTTANCSPGSTSPLSDRPPPPPGRRRGERCGSLPDTAPVPRSCLLRGVPPPGDLCPSTHARTTAMVRVGPDRAISGAPQLRPAHP